jgi:prepilin-type N-terminal cleavage/methylation domain-containing protein
MNPLRVKRNVFSVPSSAFTLIELLVVIAIIAILAVVVVLTLNPAQLLAQSRDANRVSDMATLNSALSLYQIDSGGTGNMGTSSIVYTSLSDTSSTCGNLNLPALPASSTYNCTVSTSSRNTNTSGWIPVNFQNISSGAPFGSLPLDPVNTSSSGLYYTYSTNNGQFEVTALPESQKQKASLGTKPMIPDYPNVIANGSSLTISPLFNQTGLVGYWPMDEGAGSSTQDMSGNGNTGTWSGTPVGTNNTYYTQGKIGSYAGMWSPYISGNSTYINVPIDTSLEPSQVTVSEWVNQPANMQPGYRWTGIQYGTGYYIIIDQTSLTWNIQCGSSCGVGVGATIPAYNSWYLLTGTWDGHTADIYVNGKPISSSTAAGSLTYVSPTFSIGKNGNAAASAVSLDDVRIYNRALSAAEIQALYNAGK